MTNLEFLSSIGRRRNCVFNLCFTNMLVTKEIKRCTANEYYMLCSVVIHISINFYLVYLCCKLKTFNVRQYFCLYLNKHELEISLYDKYINFRFRVLSYNILADLYCDSDFSRQELFFYCPPYALEIDYRKLLIIKELLGSQRKFPI